MKQVLLILWMIVLLLGHAIPIWAAENSASSTPIVPESPNDLPEITTIFNKDLLTQNRVLSYGDTAELDDMENALTSSFQTMAGLTDDDQEALLVVDRIELGTIDVFKPGAYPITVILKLHEDYINNFTISDETRTLHFYIYVTNKDDISLLFISSTTVRIQYEIINGQENLSLWYAVTESGTEPDSETWQLCPTDGLCILNLDSLYIYREKLTTDQEYWFQLRSTDATSNIIRINLNDLPNSSDGNYMGGDKDGNDNDDSTIVPPLIQKPPLPPSVSSENSTENNNDSKPSEPETQTPTIPPESNAETSNDVDSIPTIKPVFKTDLPDDEQIHSDSQNYEKVDGDTLTISGARLAWLIQRNSPFIPFGWNEISLSIPTEVLSALSLSSNEMLSLTLTKESNLSFTITLMVNERQIQELGSTVVRLPASEPQGRYTLSFDEVPLSTSISFENGFAVFTINQTGYYQLIEDTELESTQIPIQSTEDEEFPLPFPEKRNFLPSILAGIIMLTGSIFLYWRKRL
ncbi:MAG: hypothetical protein ACRC7V_07330 [Lachnospiraceae bacterium]